MEFTTLIEDFLEYVFFFMCGSRETHFWKLVNFLQLMSCPWVKDSWFTVRFPLLQDALHHTFKKLNNRDVNKPGPLLGAHFLLPCYGGQWQPILDVFSCVNMYLVLYVLFFLVDLVILYDLLYICLIYCVLSQHWLGDMLDSTTVVYFFASFSC